MTFLNSKKLTRVTYWTVDDSGVGVDDDVVGVVGVEVVGVDDCRVVDVEDEEVELKLDEFADDICAFELRNACKYNM